MSEFLKKIKYKFSGLGDAMAKRAFRSNTKGRVDLYKYLINGLRSNLSLNIKKVIDARIRRHERVHSKKGVIARLMKKPGGSEMPFLMECLRKINEGRSNVDIFMDGWVTPNEEMLIKSNESGQLADSLDLAIDLLTKTNNIKKSVKSQLAQPIGLFAALMGIMYGFAWYFVPILLEISDVNSWTSGQKLLYNISMFLQEKPLVLPLCVFGTGFVIVSTFGIWTGRVREWFDSYIPWSMYRDFNAALFLISLSTMMRNGTTFVNSLIEMKTASAPYVRKQIDDMLDVAKLANEDNSTALNVHMMGEVGDDIEDLSRYGDFEQVLREEGDKSIQSIIDGISKKAGIFKQIALIAVMFYIMWAFSTFMSIVQGVANSV